MLKKEIDKLLDKHYKPECEKIRKEFQKEKIKQTIDNLLDKIFEIALDVNWLDRHDSLDEDEDGHHLSYTLQEHSRQRERMKVLIETYIKENK